MLAKIEELYLNILRFAVLSVAGLALLVTVAGLGAGLFYWTQGAVSSDEPELGALDLASFIEEQRLTAGSGDDTPSTDTATRASAPVPLSPAIGHAADTIAAYLDRQRRGSADRSDIVTGLNELRSQIGIADLASYDASLTRLVDQLANSRGRPLSSDRVFELVAWHHDRFQQAIFASAHEAAERDAAAWLWLVRGGQAFLMFVIIAFYFLLVRVERHLRLVRVRREEEALIHDEFEDGAQL